MKIYMDGILQGRYSINDIVKFEVGFTDIKEMCNLECVKGEKTWI